MSKQAIFDKKNVLVIGGAGFLGSHLCDELVKENKVICLDNFSSGDEKNIDHLLANPDFAFIKHDISDPIELENIDSLQKFKVQFQGVQEIYNLACPMSPRNFEKNTFSILMVNSFGVKNALDLAVKYNAKFLHFSSSVVYGPRRDSDTPVDENYKGTVDFLSPRSSYDEGKRFAETMIKNYEKLFKIDTKILRIFRTYGPRMKLDDDQMIPDFVRNAIDNKDVVIFGDRNFSSTFCYVSDIIDAAIKTMQSDVATPINIGSDVEINVTSLAEKIIKMTGSSSEIVYGEEILFMTSLPIPDIAKARNELGWLPVITLEKGLDKTIDDLRANKGLKSMI